jgi:hypothetical protein
MNIIFEDDLVDCARNNAIKRLYLVQMENGNFSIEIELTWKDGRVQLFTQKKIVREWANLNRLIDHIQANYGKIPSISLILLDKT